MVHKPPENEKLQGKIRFTGPVGVLADMEYPYPEATVDHEGVYRYTPREEVRVAKRIIEEATEGYDLEALPRDELPRIFGADQAHIIRSSLVNATYREDEEVIDSIADSLFNNIQPAKEGMTTKESYDYFLQAEKAIEEEKKSLREKAFENRLHGDSVDDDFAKVALYIELLTPGDDGEPAPLVVKDDNTRLADKRDEQLDQERENKGPLIRRLLRKLESKVDEWPANEHEALLVIADMMLELHEEEPAKVKAIEKLLGNPEMLEAALRLIGYEPGKEDDAE